MSVFGLPLTVSTGRILFPSALAVFLLLGGISYTSWPGKRTEQQALLLRQA